MEQPLPMSLPPMMSNFGPRPGHEESFPPLSAPATSNYSDDPAPRPVTPDNMSPAPASSGINNTITSLNI